MNLSPLWISFFEQHGLDAVHWSKLGPVAASDAEIMEHARANNFIIFTHDLDFGRLLALRQSGGPSVIQIRTQDVLPAAIGELIVRALVEARSYLEAGALVSVDPKHHRIRLLPI